MKNKLIALFIVLIMIMVGIVFVVLFFPQVRNRFNKGDKITVDVNILLNEKEVVLSDLNATCIYENSVSCDVYSKDGRYSTKGNLVGTYYLDTIYNNKDNVKQENEIVIDDGILELNWGI